MVRIRLFAALREAAGVSEVEAPAGPLDGILAGLGDRFGDRFAAVLGYSSVLVDGERWHDRAAPVPDGAELALLPPFSGGSGRRGPGNPEGVPRWIEHRDGSPVDGG
jgi:molybdopterin converting factor small subunit